MSDEEQGNPEEGAQAAEHLFVRPEGLEGRPEWLPEKFWNDEKGINISGVTKSYTKLEQVRDLDAIREQVRAELAEAYTPPDEYAAELPLPEGWPEDVRIDPAEDPQIQWFRSAAKSAGLTQEQHDTLLKSWFEQDLARFKEHRQQIEAIPEYNARKENLSGKIRAKLGDDAEVLEPLLASATGLAALEKVLAPRTGEGGASGGSIAPLDLADLRQMQRDPRYADPKLRDPKFVQKVQDGFRWHAEQRKKKA